MHNRTERYLGQRAETLECDHIAAFNEHIANVGANSADRPSELQILFQMLKLGFPAVDPEPAIILHYGMKPRTLDLFRHIKNNAEIRIGRRVGFRLGPNPTRFGKPVRIRGARKRTPIRTDNT